MINVEGNYEEIIKWLDKQNGTGIRAFAGSHGALVRDDNDVEHKLNFGLFSLCDTSPPYCTEEAVSHQNCLYHDRSIELEEWDLQTEMLRRDSEYLNSNLDFYRQYNTYPDAGNHLSADDIRQFN